MMCKVYEIDEIVSHKHNFKIDRDSFDKPINSVWGTWVLLMYHKY